MKGDRDREGRRITANVEGRTADVETKVVGTLARERAQLYGGEMVFTISAPCEECGGEPERPCAACSGTGRSPGMGTPDDEACRACGASGRQTAKAGNGARANGEAETEAADCDTCGGSGWITENRPADAERDVRLEVTEIQVGPDRYDRYPDCPDCGAGGEPRILGLGAETAGIAWAEAGGVPGSRRCLTCGSRFADSRYSAAFGAEHEAAEPD